VVFPALLVLPPLLWLATALVSSAVEGGPPDATAGKLLLRSARVAAGAATAATLGGALFGWLLARYRMPGRELWGWCAFLALLLPPYAGALGWALALSPRDGALFAALQGLGAPPEVLRPYGSEVWCGWILAAAYWPVAAWLVHAAALSVPASLEDAARLHAGAGRAARWTALPALRGAVPAAALLVFLLSLADFGVPNSLGLAVYPVEIVNRFQYSRESGDAIRVALPLVALALAGVWLQGRLGLRAPEATADPTRRPALLTGATAWWGALFCLAWSAVTVLLPLGSLAAASLPPATYVAVWRESAGHLGNTLLTAGGGAALALGAAIACGALGRPRPGGPADLLLCAPYALPASLIGIAMIALLNRPGPLGALYDSLGGVVWTYGALFYPFAHKLLEPAWARVDADLLAEGASLGAGPWARFRHSQWPVIRPQAALAGGVVAVLAAREMDATALLRPPGGDTVAFRIHDYLHFGPTPNVAALCLVVVGVGLVTAALVRACLPGRRPEAPP
jgi:iron(III) transport system permease protein